MLPMRLHLALQRVGAVLLIAVGVLLVSGALHALSAQLAGFGSAETSWLGGLDSPTLALAFVAGALPRNDGPGARWSSVMHRPAVRAATP